MSQEKDILCPECGSDNVSAPRYSARSIALSLLLLGIPIPFTGKTCHCFECGLDFKKKKEAVKE
jgi:hypothetical protein